jgi:hypothetical protein
VTLDVGQDITQAPALLDPLINPLLSGGPDGL